MGYWNRDRIKRDGEPFTCWHDDCFPVRRPEWWEVAQAGHPLPGVKSAKDHTLTILGGREHVREVVESTRYALTADDVLWQYRKSQMPVTPDGYAWAPWLMGAPCAVCGVQD